MKPQDAWNATLNQLELQFDRATYDTWLRRTTFLRYEEPVFVIGIHNEYARDMLQFRLYRTIQRVLTDIFGQSVELTFEVCKQEPAAPKQDDPSDMPLFQLLAQREREDRPADTLHQLVRSVDRPGLPDSELNPKFTFDRFVMNDSNRVVYEAACAIAEYPASVYNPFLVYGGVGLGKTHILQAIAHVCQERGLRTLYISAEAFTNDLVSAIRERSTAMFRNKYRSVDVLLVDDVQFIGGKESTQQEFFHTFNTLVNFNKQIVLGSDRHPRELATLEDRLRSRFQGGLVADIQPPEFETRVAILQMWARESEIDLGMNVLEMVAERAPNNIRELKGVFNQIVAQTRLNRGEPLSIKSAEFTLERYTRPRYHVTPRRIIDTVAREYNLKPSDLTGKRRTGRINLARQIAMYLVREITDLSLPQIGDAFGGRSHTTVLHGCNKIAEAMDYDRVLAARIDRIQQAILDG